MIAILSVFVGLYAAYIAFAVSMSRLLNRHSEDGGVIAGVSFWRFYFRFFPGSIKSPQIIEFLKALQATIGRKLLIVWDRLQAHRSRLVKAHVEAQRGMIALEYLPPYAPELNPVEYIWAYLKHHAMPNYCARNLGDLRHRASRHLRSMRRGTLVTAFWRQAELF